jgi:glycosyltransferase involved in cell wall biosynthesis
VKVAIVHDWFTAMRGGERCVEAFCELYPDADLFTLLHFKGAVSPTIERMKMRTSFIQYLPLVKRFYRHYLPLFPMAIERFDLRDYDLILSSSHCVAKGIHHLSSTLHVSYTYTPMRYAWDLYDDYFQERVSGLSASILQSIMASLRAWDLRASGRVDQFIAISHHIADRIKRHYDRDADVIYPPVDLHRFSVSGKDEGFYLIVSAFAPYKRVDLAIEACNRTHRCLKIIGAGQDAKRLTEMAGPTVEMLGWQPDDVVRDYYARCSALLFPGEEDFGIVPLEVMACGKPVIAYGKGGVLETVIPMNPRLPAFSDVSPTGVFFYEQSAKAVVEALDLFETHRDGFDPQNIRSHVEPFDRIHFKERIKQFIDQAWQEHPRSTLC